MSIGVAIIGSGIFAKTEHLPAVLATPQLTLKAVFSRSKTSAQSLISSIPAQGGQPKKVDIYSDDGDASQDLDALFDREDIHAVIIGLPIVAQPDFIRLALESHKHVLSEKPIAASLVEATFLQLFYSSLPPSHSSTTWAVAENYRFLPSFLFGRDAIARLGRILSTHVRVHSLVKPGGKYFETAWRKTPEYQGGFLLDGGVHFTAAARLLLSATKPDRILRVSAFTRQLQEHLPPVDTVDAVFQSEQGVTGTFAVSFGTTTDAWEFTVACENGSVTVGRDVVTVREGGQREGKETVTRFEDQGSGVKEEVKAWAEALAKGKQSGKVEIDARQQPHEAMYDLETLELMLKSGKNGGEVQDVKNIVIGGE